MDVETLLKALDNEDNSHLLNMTTTKIKKIKLEILREINLPRAILLEYMEKLKEYRYIDEMNELKYGSFIRWIPITNPEDLPLKQGGIFCEMNITEKGVFIVCKSFAHRHYQIKMDECLIFQKMTNQEQVLLSALDHLAK
jgi:hypothetical protein